MFGYLIEENKDAHEYNFYCEEIEPLTFHSDKMGFLRCPHFNPLNCFYSAY